MKPRSARRYAQPRAALWAALALPAVAGAEPPVGVSQSALHACAIIAAASERLSCYDQLSGREAQSGAGGARTAATATPAAGAEPTAAAAAGTAAAPAGSESFGLYAVEHPAAPLAPSLRARVISVAGGASGRMTVELEGGQWWELADADPLLAAGDTVSIRRATLGSFMMETPTRRTHHVRRLR